MKDEPEERKGGIGGAEQLMLILLSIYKCEGLHVPSGVLHARFVARRRGRDDSAERATSGQENLLQEQGSEHVPDCSVRAAQAINLPCLGTLEQRSSRLVAVSCDLQYI